MSDKKPVPPAIAESGEQAAIDLTVQNVEILRAEIAKRDARIVELEAQYQRDVYGLNNEGDPIGGEPVGGYANDNARLRAELAALKAQPSGMVLPDLHSAVLDAFAAYERFGTDCLLEGMPMIQAGVLEELAELARLNPCRAQAVPDGKICVTTSALYEVLYALVNAPHQIRELQATREPAELFADNPINILVAEYTAAQQSESE